MPVSKKKNILLVSLFAALLSCDIILGYIFAINNVGWLLEYGVEYGVIVFGTLVLFPFVFNLISYMIIQWNTFWVNLITLLLYAPFFLGEEITHLPLLSVYPLASIMLSFILMLFISGVVKVTTRRAEESQKVVDRCEKMESYPNVRVIRSFNDNIYELIDTDKEVSYCSQKLIQKNMEHEVLWELKLSSLKKLLIDYNDFLVDFEVIDQATIRIWSFSCYSYRYDIREDKILDSHFTK